MASKSKKSSETEPADPVLAALQNISSRLERLESSPASSSSASDGAPAAPPRSRKKHRISAAHSAFEDAPGDFTVDLAKRVEAIEEHLGIEKEPAKPEEPSAAGAEA